MTGATKTRASRNGRGRATATPPTPSWNDIVGPAMRTVVDALPKGANNPWQRLQALRRDLPVTAMGKTGELAHKLRQITGRDVIDLESMQDVLSVFYRLMAVREERQQGRWEIDDFGFDRAWSEAILPLVRVVYRKYWRVSATGLENIPPSGALLVSNHAGVLPFDAAMIRIAVFDHGGERHVRPLVATWMFKQPVLSGFIRRTGQTLGHPSDTHRLLTNGELVLVFPEGIAGTGKPFSERYKLQRFGRGGFIQAALRAGVPIVPISVIGSEEIYPMFGNIKPLAKLVGLPYVPITPLGLIPLPSKWSIRFHEPLRTDSMGPAAADDPATVLQLTDDVRDVIQKGLIEGLRNRRSVFSG